MLVESRSLRPAATVESSALAGGPARAFRVLGLVATLLVAGTLAGTFLIPLPKPAWYTTDLAASASTVSMTRDARGTLGVVISNQTGLYAITNATGGWETTLLAPGLTCCASAAVDSSGRLHVVYVAGSTLSYPPTPINATYVTWDGTHLSSTVLFSGQEVWSPSLALDSQGHVHISFIAYTYGVEQKEWLMYATDESGTVNVSVIAGPVPLGYSAFLGDSLALDPHNGVYVAVSSPPANGSVGVYHRVGTAWQFEPVDHSADWVDSVSLAIDPVGHLHLVYPFLPSLNGTTVVRYATNATGAWETTDLAATSIRFSTLGIDGAGDPHVLLAGNDTWVIHAAQVDGSWVLTPVGTSKVNFLEYYAFALSLGPADRIDVALISESGSNPLQLYTNQVPPPTAVSYLLRAAPWLLWELGGAAAAGVVLFAVTRAQATIRERREWKARAEADHEKFMRTH